MASYNELYRLAKTHGITFDGRPTKATVIKALKKKGVAMPPKKKKKSAKKKSTKKVVKKTAAKKVAKKKSASGSSKTLKKSPAKKSSICKRVNCDKGYYKSMGHRIIMRPCPGCNPDGK